MLKTEMNHDEVDEIITKIKKINGWIVLNKMFYVLFLVMLDIVEL